VIQSLFCNSIAPRMPTMWSTALGDSRDKVLRSALCASQRRAFECVGARLTALHVSPACHANEPGPPNSVHMRSTSVSD
jgi:hypothetical protein